MHCAHNRFGNIRFSCVLYAVPSPQSSGNYHRNRLHQIASMGPCAQIIVLGRCLTNSSTIACMSMGLAHRACFNSVSGSPSLAGLRLASLVHPGPQRAALHHRGSSDRLRAHPPHQECYQRWFRSYPARYLLPATHAVGLCAFPSPPGVHGAGFELEIRFHRASFWGNGLGVALRYKSRTSAVCATVKPTDPGVAILLQKQKCTLKSRSDAVNRVRPVNPT